MAESYLRCFIGHEAEIFSAGTAPTRISDLAVDVMLDDNIDLRQATSKPIAAFKKHSFDYIITVCDTAAQDMPKKPRALARLHYGVPDPDRWVDSSPGERLAHYIHCREDIKRQMLRFIGQYMRQPISDSSAEKNLH